MIDTHTHYYLKPFNGDRFMLLRQLRENNINRVIEAAIDMESNFTMRKYFADEDMVYYGTGLHPLRVAYADRIYGLQTCKNVLAELLRTPKTVAVGETGLDYHRNVECDDDKELQKVYFRMQLELALEYDMPLILHIRDCHEDALEILESFGKPFKGVCHCFIGGADIAKRYTDLGFYLGIGGSCTYFGNKGRFEDFIRDLPLLPMDRIVLETDSPYLLPSGCRGKRNTSLNLSAVVSTLAQAQNMTAGEIEMITERNAEECFFKNSGAQRTGISL